MKKVVKQIRCVDSNYVPLTRDKIYDVLIENDLTYYIINDSNNRSSYYKGRFVEVENNVNYECWI